MKTLEQFIGDYNGYSVPNNGGNYKGECVSLAARFAQEVQVVPGGDSVLYCSGQHGPTNEGGARDLYERFDGQLPKYYDRIPYGQPRARGDLVVWGSNLGAYGDVAIALDGGNRVFGQLGTPVFQPARIREENRQPLGYLRLKGSGGKVMSQDGEIINVYQTVNDRPATPQEVDVYNKKLWTAPDGLLYGKIIPDIKNLRANVQKYADGANYATNVANVRGDRLNKIAEVLGATSGDDYDTILTKLESLKNSTGGGTSNLDKENNSILKQILAKITGIFK